MVKHGPRKGIDAGSKEGAKFHNDGHTQGKWDNDHRPPKK